MADPYLGWDPRSANPVGVLRPSTSGSGEAKVPDRATATSTSREIRTPRPIADHGPGSASCPPDFQADKNAGGPFSVPNQPPFNITHP